MCVHVLRQAQFEVKLPRAAVRWVLTIAVRKGETNLDYFKEIHVTPAQHGFAEVVSHYD